MAKLGTSQLKEDDFLLEIGKRIRHFREEKKMSQTELALLCRYNLDYSQISRMELGKVNFSISYLKVVADALRVTPQDLLPQRDS